MVFNELYKQAENVPVILSIDLGFIDKTAKTSQFKKPEQIFKYSTELEEKIIREYEKRNPPEPAKPRFDSVLQPTVAPPVVKTSPPHLTPVAVQAKNAEIAEFDPAATPQSPWDVPTTVKDDIDELKQAFGRTSVSPPLPVAEEEEAEEKETLEKMAADYLPEGSMTDRYVLEKALEKAEKLGLSHDDALRGFFTFQEEPEQIPLFLDNFATFVDLGFDLEKIHFSLIHHKNNREEALEELMKGD